ncbi:hypothetical protein LS70_008955 [Helicobacter sp. MIT 11-5569]|uniref:hypothetical protein n=1 Tax=Helicobacter sp. MIT 11-5569 TaxID=1548151 RepID=UPI0010FECE0C|nr:hypothetical protein [Helicobacter sp. MIT 11-5569]TLD80688.1 hypothetical protein LS70_008955 [Helicobacter sp. MIT 11-5569]
MKKLLATLFLSLALVSSAYATDLIALATNGKMNENSLGVKVLSDDEMKKVVGGVQENRIAPIVGWRIRQGVMWGIRYTAWGAHNQRHPLNGNNGWHW